MENLRRELIKNNPYFKRLDKFYKNKSLNYLLHILENNLKNNLNTIDQFNLKNDSYFENNLYNDWIDKLNYSESILLLNYWIQKKYNPYEKI